MRTSLDSLDAVAAAIEPYDMQLKASEVYCIVRNVKPPVNLLVFGMGRDSAFWRQFNDGGRTAFIENNPAWLGNVSKANPGIEAVPCEYTTKRSEWREIYRDIGRLYLDLPASITHSSWDVVLVDGPAGYSDECPGRMQSIYMARLLANLTKGQVFVHDMHRPVEQFYAYRFLGPEAERAHGWTILSRFTHNA